MNKEQFNEISTQYLIALPSMKKSDKTVTAYSLAFRKFSDFLKADEQITPLTVVNWRSSLSMSGIKTNSVRQYMIFIHSFFEWCVKMKIEQENPVHLDEIPEQQRVEYDLLTLDEIKSLITKTPTGLSGKTIIRNRAIIVLLLQAGLRNSELRSLTVADLDFEQNRIMVRHGKGDKQRLVAMPRIAKEIIEEYLSSGIRPDWCTDNDYLFGTDSDENGKSTGGKLWKQFSSPALLMLVHRYTEHCCGHSVKTHALRHAFTSLCDLSGMPMTEISQNLGHSNPLVTAQVYRHILNKDTAIQSAVSAMDKFTNSLQGV